MDFMNFKAAVNRQFTMMEDHGLFTTNVGKDELWDAYLNSFPEGSNPIYRERTEHDCQCCKQFIRACGNVVSIIDNKVVSIWDIEIEDQAYQIVADAMSALVRHRSITNIFLHYEKNLGTDHNFEDKEGVIKEWNHFHYKLKPSNVNSRDLDSVLGSYRTSVQTFKRALEEISSEAIDTVLELIDQNSIYRGEEYGAIVTEFMRHKNKYVQLNEEYRDIYCWNSKPSGSISGIRNTSIGTLLVDLSDGKDLNSAVGSYEAKVAPHNYKRPTALITSGMINRAQDKVEELGIEDSLKRRYAHTDDLTINNVLFANRDTKQTMNVFDEMNNEVAVDISKLDKVEEVTIDKFIKDILPKANSLELMFENKHLNNLVSLIAPVVDDSPNILKWGNNFTWSYNGEVTDSMKERVKTAGGSVDGILRGTIQWNEKGSDGSNDLDLHCRLPTAHIYFAKNKDSKSGGWLDVDITRPNSHQTPADNIAVENITWQDLNKMPDGKYSFYVHNFQGRNQDGFRAQIEMDGITHEFSYDRPVTSDVKIATVTLSHGQFTIECHLDSNKSTKEAWNINTHTFQNVSMVMKSPNHWDDNNIGNKHWFFMLTDCKNENSSRGFYNEFLSDDLKEHRKVFEVLGSKLKTEISDNQLSGLGFSSTKRDSVLCKVSGSFNRTIKINF